MDDAIVFTCTTQVHDARTVLKGSWESRYVGRTEKPVRYMQRMFK